MGNCCSGANNEDSSFNQVDNQTNHAHSKDQGLANRYKSKPKDTNKKATKPTVVSLPQLHSSLVFTCCSVNDSTFISGSEDSSLALCDWQNSSNDTAIVHKFLGHKRSLSRLALSHNHELLASSSRDLSIRIWSLARNSQNDVSSIASDPLHIITSHSLVPTGLDFTRHDASTSSSGQLISGSRDYSMRWHDTETGQQMVCHSIQQNCVTGLQTFHHAPLVLQSSEDLLLRIWDARLQSQAGGVAQSCNDGPNFALSCAVSADDEYALTTHNGFQSQGSQVKLWSMKQLKLVKEWSANGTDASDCAHTEAVHAGRLITLQNKLYAITVSKDQSLKVFDVQEECIHTEPMLNELSPLCVSVSACLDSPTAMQIVVGSTGALVSVFRFDVAVREMRLIARTAAQGTAS